MAILSDLLCAVLLALALRGLGARLRRVARVPLAPGLRFAADFLVGCGALALTVLVVGLLGWLRPMVLGALVLAALLAGRHRALGADLRPLLWPALAALLALPAALASPFFYDSLVYHLGLPAQALLDGRIAAHPENLFSTFPPLAQLLAVLPLAAGCERVPALLHLLSFVVAGAAVRFTAIEFGARDAAAAGAGAVFLLMPVAFPVSGLPAAEGYLVASVATLMALLWQRHWRPGGAVWIGLLGGVAISARLQGLLWLAIALAALLFRGRSLRAALPVSMMMAGASVLWWGKNGLLLGQPFAPLGWVREGVDTLWRDGQSHVAGGLAALVHPRGWWAALLPHLGLLLPLALLALLGRRLAPVAGRWLPLLVVVLGLGGWYATGSLGRFLAPSVALLLALAAALPRRWSALSLCLFGALSVWGVGRAVLWYAELGGAAFLTGSGAELRSRLVVSDPFPAFAAARALPLGARVLFIGEPRGYGFPRRFVAPSQHDVPPLREPLEAAPDAEAVRLWLERNGYTHLLINWAELRRLETAYPVAPFRTPAGRARFAALLDLMGDPVVAAGATEIYRVLPAAGAVRPVD